MDHLSSDCWYTLETVIILPGGHALQKSPPSLGFFLMKLAVLSSTTSSTSIFTYLLPSENFSIIITDTVLYNFSKQFPVRRLLSKGKADLSFSSQRMIDWMIFFSVIFIYQKECFFTSYTVLHPLKLPHSTTVSVWNLIRRFLYFAAINVHKSMVVSFKWL